MRERYILNHLYKGYLLELCIKLQISLINTLKSKGPKVEPWGTPDFTTKENESVPELRTEECLFSR
jgi:hypothetical protein